MTEIEKALKAPFPEDDLEWRIQQSGVKKDGKPWAMVLTYITARAIMDRLDKVFGPENWDVKYEKVDGGFFCTIGALINGEWIYKTDGADATDVEAFKGGISSSIKRAAVPWGIGRYLYKLESNFARVSDKWIPGAQKGYIKEKNIEFYWLPPELPKWALPTAVEETTLMKEGTEETLARVSESVERKNREAQKATEAQQGQAGGVPQEIKTTAQIERELKACSTIGDLFRVWTESRDSLLTLKDSEYKPIKKLKDSLQSSFASKAQGLNQGQVITEALP